MTAFRSFLTRLRELVTRPRVERELDEEIQHHLDLLTDEHVRRGLSRDDARAAARRSFGGVDQAVEAVRDRRGFRAVDTVWRDLTHAARSLAASPGFTASAVLTLALGIGVNAAIFALVDAVMLRPLPYPDPDRVVAVWETSTEASLRAPGTPQRIAVAPANLADYQRRAGDVIEIAGFTEEARSIVGAGAPERLGAEVVSAEYFAVLGMQPTLGRAFHPGEFTPGNDAVVVITDRLWRARFNADPSVLGRSLALDGRTIEVIGVMPPGFEAVTDYSAPVDLLLPLALPADMLTGRGEHILSAVGRVAPGVSIETARARLRQAAEAVALAAPEARGLGADIGPLRDDQVEASGASTLLLVLLGAVALVLLTACANIASLLIVRSMARRREIAVRVALGAARSRLVLHVAAESVVLAVLGAAAGVLLGYVATNVLVSIAPVSIPRLADVTFGGRVVVFAGLAACGAALLIGLMPAFQVSRAMPSDVLHSSSRSIVGAWLHRSRALLLVGEVALSVILLVGALLMARSLIRLNAVPLGFDPSRVLAVGVALPPQRYPTPLQRLTLFEAVEARLATQPGVVSVAFANRLPLRGNWTSGLFLEPGPEAATPERPVESGYQAVSPGYRETFGIPLRRGRWLEPSDRQEAEPVAVVNEAFGRDLLGGVDPIGRRLRRSPDQPWVRIVGVVGDIRRGGRTAAVLPQVYVPAAQVRQYPLHLSDLAVRASADARGLEAAVRDAIWAEDPTQPLTRVRTLDETLELGQAEREFRTWLFLLFAALALALAIVGIYGVVSYAVSQRTNEIGLRMALGAGRPRILAWVLRQAAWPAAIGAVLGLTAAWGLSRYVASLLFEVEPTDVASYGLSAAIVAFVAIGASLGAGRRATHLDPADVLK